METNFEQRTTSKFPSLAYLTVRMPAETMDDDWMIWDAFRVGIFRTKAMTVDGSLFQKSQKLRSNGYITEMTLE